MATFRCNYIYCVFLSITGLHNGDFFEGLILNLAKVFAFDYPLQWRHNERDGVSNHQPHDCLLNRLFRRRSKEISKLRVTGLYAGNLPVTGEFPAQRASDAENVSIWWRHHELTLETQGKIIYRECFLQNITGSNEDLMSHDLCRFSRKFTHAS